MDVPLTPELERLIQEKVASGQYESPAEVVREAVRLLIRRDEEYQARLEALRREIQIGLDQLDRGEAIIADDEFFEAIKRNGRARLRERRSA